MERYCVKNILGGRIVAMLDGGFANGERVWTWIRDHCARRAGGLLRKGEIGKVVAMDKAKTASADTVVLFYHDHLSDSL